MRRLQRRIASRFLKREAASGLFGYTKATQKKAEAAIRKVQKKAEILSSSLEGKHPEAGTYLLLRCDRSKCTASKALAKTCVFNKPAKRLLKGPLGYKPTCVKACHRAVSDLTMAAGEVGYNLHQRGTDLIPFLKEYSKRKRCPYAKLIVETYPHIVQEEL